MTKKIELPKREIKFRIWDKENKKMFYKGVSPDRIYMGLDGKLYNGLNGQDFSDNFILMQYTGLKDKNGKEVYEGDIVRIKSCGDEYIDVVRFYIDGDCQSCFRTGMLGWHRDEIEVIGNIFENSELLTAKKVEQNKIISNMQLEEEKLSKEEKEKIGEMEKEIAFRRKAAWEDLLPDEKIERMREVVKRDQKRYERLLRGLAKKVDKLMGHTHRENGDIVVPLNEENILYGLEEEECMMEPDGKVWF